MTQTLIAPVCPHLELNMRPEWNQRTYWCSACRKKIIVPMYQTSLSDRNAQENFGGMIGLTFGEQWGNLAKEGKI
jgi:hypothetical protein